MISLQTVYAPLKTFKLILSLSMKSSTKFPVVCLRCSTMLVYFQHLLLRCLLVHFRCLYMTSIELIIYLSQMSNDFTLVVF